jgi:hypothetical protein
VTKNSDGVSEEGQWQEGKRQGAFIYTMMDGTRYERVYKHDEMTSETPIA